MKYYIIIAAVILLETALSRAQMAADYYTPMSIGSHVTLNTVSVGPSSTWAFRTTTYAFEGSDIISGREYFRERAFEILDQSADTGTFRVFWLRRDSVGNVALGAMNTSNGSTNIDSATIMSIPNWFPMEFLTSGYFRSYPFGNLTYQDSTLSVTESVTVQAGTFNNCLETSVTHFDSAGTPVFREYQYYVSGIGLVKNVRTLPITEANTGELTSYGTTGVNGNPNTETARRFSLLQNYPNPFNPATNIAFTLPAKSFASLKIFDVVGREVATVVSGELSSGMHAYTWHAGAQGSGVYFYRLQAGSFVETRKLLLLK
jgi:hypothetical protein